ncbi:hypothetical protein BC624_11174 [Flavobacterium granuli]|uniref:Uncharacterized protein n=1 Tax=Flavobacterium granuli TaxID=280093 RepID=A0A1M5T510_9FLAO|nr:hypothetical protein BC624_11174 [Flavobacterium granuli]SHH45851.1 hypothetical protein SAMN05443373_11374 [Flavobacterium granuli]
MSEYNNPYDVINSFECLYYLLELDKLMMLLYENVLVCLSAETRIIMNRHLTHCRKHTSSNWMMIGHIRTLKEKIYSKTRCCNE